MFYSDAILSKKGSLAKVWLAAHWERKLSKSQFLQTNIETSVGAIVGDGQQPMALRLSGQLLLGVVRIYSRKARYLLEDCNEALIKIKMAFRPGVVDMPNETAMANFNAITLPDAINEYDILLPEPALNLSNLLRDQDAIDEYTPSQNISRTADITLRDSQASQPSKGDDLPDLDLFSNELGDIPEVENALNFNLDFNGDGDGMDLFSGERVSEVPEVELGREAAEPLPFEPEPLELDTSLQKDDEGVDSRASNAFEEPSLEESGPSLVNGDGAIHFDGPDFDNPQEYELRILPAKSKRTRAAKPDGGEEASRESPKKVNKRRKVIVDDKIELPSAQMKKQLADTSDIIMTEKYVPTSLRSLEINLMRRRGNESSRAPAIGVPAELAFLFDFRKMPVAVPEIDDLLDNDGDGEVINPERANELVEEQPEETEQPVPASPPRRKRKVTDTEDDDIADDVDPTRRKTESGEEDHNGSGGVEEVLPVDSTLEESLNEVPMEDAGSAFDLGMNYLVEETHGLPENERIEYKEATAEKVGPKRNSHGGLALYESLEEPNGEEEQISSEKGFSKSTISTIKILQERFEGVKPSEKLSFSDISSDARRSDGARLFFELLVLRTKNMIDIKQDSAYGDIKIGQKKALFAPVAV
ncbi:sister chromatid cohesion protein 1 [Irineochytrium annulatum]|nr:sister chromatid cohesion protein 1 [Irineochytrium annulatum]